MQRIGRMAMATATLVAAAAALTGCSSIRDHRGFIVDPMLTDSIQPNLDNRLSVEKTLGRPTFISQFGEPVWYYVSIDTRQKAFAGPQTKAQQVLKIRFDPAGTVRAVERSGIEQVARIDPDGNKTPTLGANRSFFEDLFGNIGSVGAPGMGGPNNDNTGGGRGPNGS